MVLWCGTVGKSGLDLTEALLTGLLLQGAWDVPAIPSGMPSAGMKGCGCQVGEVTGALSVWWGEQNTFWHTGFCRPSLVWAQTSRFCSGSFLSQLCAAARPSMHCQCGMARAAPCPNGHNRPGASCPSQQGSGAAELPSPVSAQHHLTSKPHHETVLLLSDHVTSLKLCGGSTKSPVFSFAKLSQVIQSPECFFCQSEFAVIKLHSCEG